jgi:hypothetical protein
MTAEDKQRQKWHNTHQAFPDIDARIKLITQMFSRPMAHDLQPGRSAGHNQLPAILLMALGL